MRKFLVLHRRNLPTEIPLERTALILLMLHYFNSPTWLWVLLCFLLLCRWVVVLYRLTKEKQYDLFPETVREIEEPEKDLKATFRKIIKDASI